MTRVLFYINHVLFLGNLFYVAEQFCTVAS